MTLVILILIALCFTVLLVNWRWGIYLIVLVGFLQDPVRKLIAGQPVHYSTAVIFVFAISLLLAFIINDSWRIRYITLDNSKLEVSIATFIGFVVFSSLYTYFSYGSPIVSIIGIAIYLGPIAAAVYSSLIFDSYTAIKNFITLYLIGIVVLIITIWMSVLGFEHLALEEIGGGIDIYEHSIGHYLDVHAGMARTSEIAAWHLASGACFSLILAVHSKGDFKKIILCLLAITCLLTGIFTGRRKMYALFTIFILTILLFVFFESKAKHKNYVIFSVLSLGIVLISLYVIFQQQILLLSFASDYLSRVFTLVGDTADRVSLTLSMVNYTLGNLDLIGDGIGSTGQGVTGFSIGNRTWNAETGLGRLGNELGILGLIAFLLMLVYLLNHIIFINKITKHYNSQFGFFQRAMVAFLFANAINYVNAAQAYNDLFILLVLGLSLGCILAGPKILYKASISTT